MNKVILIILDGWGYRKEKKYNAIASAHTPNFNKFWKNYPHAILKASGEAIGLPEGQIGTSEANHLIIGSGRILFQNLMRINRAIQSGALSKNEAINEAFEHVKKHNSTLHVKGIVSPGGVHGHTDHIKAIVKAAKEAGVKHIMLHLFTDGRDVLPKSAMDYIKDMELFLKTIGVGRISTIGGRYWAMDRDQNLDRTEKHFRVMVIGDGPRFKSAIEVIDDAYRKGITDEFIDPSLIETEEGEIGTVQANDAMISTIFRADRAKQLTRRFLKEGIKNFKYVALTQYAQDIDVRVAFPPEEIKNTLSNVLSKNKISQLRVTETEKYNHLTFFFNAQNEKPDSFEDRIMIPSDKTVKTYDEKPEMEVLTIAKTIVDDLLSNPPKQMTREKEIPQASDDFSIRSPVASTNKKGTYNKILNKNYVVKKAHSNNSGHNFIATNLVNADMVGHTGNFAAIVKAVEAVDKAIGIIVEAAQRVGADVIITADHGNAEETYDELKKQPITAHTLNPVPFILISNKYKKINHKVGSLADIAPTILKLFGIKPPPEMTGKSFL